MVIQMDKRFSLEEIQFNLRQLCFETILLDCTQDFKS